MTQEDLTKRFSCGAIEKEYEKARALSFMFQLAFTAVGIYFFWLMLPERTIAAKLDNIAVLCFCLWQIHRQRDILCYTTAKGLIVRRQCTSARDLLSGQLHPEKQLLFVPYRDIFEIADTWRDFRLGQPIEGGLVILPVQLQFLSGKDKREILDRIRDGAEKDEEE